MTIMFYENSSGFAHYTYELCNAVGAMLDDDILYITDSLNNYTNKLKDNVRGLPILKPLTKKFKKNSVLWVFDRAIISLNNILIRNKIVKREKPNVISIQNTIPIIDQFFLRNLKKYTKIIITVHDVVMPQKSISWNKKSLKRIYKIADKLIVHSELNKQQLCDIFGIESSKVIIIHHGTHSQFHQLDTNCCKEKVGVCNGKKTLLFFGGIRESKGLDILIKALNGIDCNLIVAGAMPFGETFDKYEKLIRENKIICKKYIEYISDEFSEVLFQASDLIVLPYVFFLSQSGVFMQAMQYRKPILATDVSCFREYIDKYQIGMICKPNDVDSLHHALTIMLSNFNDNQKYTKNIETALEENSWEKSAEKHLIVFNDIESF